jgi:hypothetical protein
MLEKGAALVSLLGRERDSRGLLEKDAGALTCNSHATRDVLIKVSFSEDI